jgi:hypothetical protein
VLILIFIVGGIIGLWGASRSQISLRFLLYLLPAILALVVVPFLTYRAYALQRANYLVERDGFRLQWGLRSEDIPMDVVEWVGTEDDLDFKLPNPPFRLPGSVLGVRQLPEERTLEYLAARSRSLMLIATHRRVFAISPDDNQEFIRAFREVTELGSLTPIPARSVYPAFMFSRSWADRPARILILLGGLLSILFLVWVILTAPTRASISLRFTPTGLPTESVPSVRLLLLPVVNLFIFFVDLFLGLFLYRRTESQPVAYMLWVTSILTSLLFMGALFFILRGG